MTKQAFQQQKELASDLDLLAGRAHHIGAEPATRKQCWFLAGLMLQAGIERPNYNDVLTKREASRRIDSYLSIR